MEKRWGITVLAIVVVFLLSFSFFKTSASGNKVFAQGEQVGRYQMTAYGEDFYVLDTTNGKIWLFHRQATADKSRDMLIPDSTYQVGQ